MQLELDLKATKSIKQEEKNGGDFMVKKLIKALQSL